MLNITEPVMTESNTRHGYAESLQVFYKQGITRDISWRLAKLKELKKAILSRVESINKALWEDLRKSEGEAYLTEIGVVIGEIDYHVKHLRRWAKGKRVPTPLPFLPSRSRIMYEPYGVVLIIAPWNYPFQLIMAPLIGAISAGNCAVLKPSPFAPATTKVLGEIVAAVFAPGHVAMFEGDGEMVNRLLEERFDYIFFTGGPRFGRQVMEAASRHLTPVTLELGGKSPCIVDRDANLEIAARRVAWGKFLNAGQTCVAPDYVLIPAEREAAFVAAVKRAIQLFYGENPAESPNYTRIIHQEGTKRLMKLMHSSGQVVVGGEVDVEDKYIAPTVLTGVEPDSPIMREEIFGPVLPILNYKELDEAIDFVNKREKPLALYYFGPSASAEKVLKYTTSGGACINDTIIHVGNFHLPFGGVGTSGMGKYHGKASFELFSNLKSVVISPTFIDNHFRYAPYKHLKLIKKFM